MEYPTIGDVDNDDEAEMVATCRSSLNIFKSGSLPWRDATQVWNTNSFNVTCVNQDGTIPADPIENYTLYNNFLSQVVLNGPSDTVAIAIPDAFINIVNAENQCGGDVLLELEICNQGAAPMPAGTPIAVYIDDPRVEASLLQTLALHADLAVGECVLRNFQHQGIEASDLHIFAVVNDNGQQPLPYILDDIENGGDFPFTGIIECDYTNNLADSLIVFEYASEGTEDAVVCENDVFVFNNVSYSEAGTYQIVLEAENGCDSLVILNLEVIERGISYESATICMGEGYEFANNTLSVAGTYYDTILVDGLCDSLVQLDLTVLPDVFSITYADICEGESYLFNGDFYLAAGEYSDTLFNATTNGCDSIIVLDLSVHTPSSEELEVSICEGQSYTFNGQELSQTDVYVDTLENFYGCDSVLTLHLTALPILLDTIRATICEGNTYYFGNQGYSQSGTYQQSFISSTGCDSTVTLLLSIEPKFSTEIYDTICRGDAYFFAGYYYTEQGIFPKYYTSINGCDSVVTLHLFLQNPNYEEDHITVCEGETYQFGDNEIVVNQFGVYHDTFTNRLGCDSFVWMHLYPIPSFESETSAVICEGESFEWEGNTYLESGTYQEVYAASNGCDSTFTLELNVHPSIEETAFASLCEGESFIFGDSMLLTSGFYEQSFQTENGCDSIVHLQLFFLAAQEIFLDKTLCEGESITIGETSYNAPGTYIENLIGANGCDSIVHLNLAILESTSTPISATICEGDSYLFGNNSLSEAGLYWDTLSAITSCDSILALSLEVLPSYDVPMSIALCEGESIELGGAVYEEGGSYLIELTTSDGCDSIINLDIDVHPSFETQASANICQGEVYLFGDQSLTVSGNYENVLMSEQGCDSLVSLQLFVLPAFHLTLEEAICEGESFEMGGVAYTESGFFIDTLTAQNGCDSIIRLDLSVVPDSYTFLEPQSICEGETIEFYGQTISSSGTYEEVFSSTNCDSIVVLEVNVLEGELEWIAASICEPEFYVFEGDTLTETGVYAVTYPLPNGCSKIITLDLTIFENTETYISETICEGNSLLFHDNYLTEAGNYQIALESTHACDSIVHLQLFVLPILEESITTTICEGESFFIGEHEFTEAGEYWQTLPSLSTSCDSVVQLVLDVVPPVYLDQTFSICEGEIFSVGANEYMETGMYFDTLVSAITGCDSIVTTGLSVLPPVETVLDTLICSGEVVIIGSTAYENSGTYIQNLSSLVTSCDSMVTLHLEVLENLETALSEVICEGTTYSVGNQTFSETGTYEIELATASFSCDSTVFLDLTVVPHINLDLTQTICEGESVSIGNNTYNTTGTYTNNLSTIHGCDSTVVLKLEVLPDVETMVEEIVCEGTHIQIGSGIFIALLDYTRLFCKQKTVVIALFI